MDRINVQFSSAILPIIASLVWIIAPCVTAFADAGPVLESRVGNPSFVGSTIVLVTGSFLPDLIYKKYPTDEPVGPLAIWRLSIGVALESTAPSISATLRLDNAGQNPQIQILDDNATLVEQGGLYNNYDVLQHFEVVYNGNLQPFIGPVDFILAVDGFSDIPLRVHLNVIEQPGFPIAISFPSIEVSAPLGDINGDGNLEILVPVGFGDPGLHAFDHSGAVVAGWPFVIDDPEVTEQGYSTPAIVDLDGDGTQEIVVVGHTRRNVLVEGVFAGTEITNSLYAINGSGQLLWQVDDEFPHAAIAAIADIDGDMNLDIVVGVGTNMKRFNTDGVPLNGWQVETLNDLNITIPVIADVDADPSNGLEIIACTPVFGPPTIYQIYVWNQDGTLHSSAWPKSVEDCQAPTVLDLDGDPANGLEIVMAVEHDDPPVDPDTGFNNTFTVFAWHADGSDVAGWPHHFLRDPNATFFDDRVPSTELAGDVDGDGDMEVIVATYGQGDPANGNLFLFHHDGTLDENWPQWAGHGQTPTKFGGRAMADLDADGQLEIVTASFLGVYVFRSDGRTFEGFPRMTLDNFAQPMVADIDGDGALEIVELSVVDGLHVWKMLTPSFDPLPWPLFRQNSAATGSPDRSLVANVPTLSQAGVVAAFCLLIVAGIILFRRKAL